MAITAKPEILPPPRPGGTGVFSDRNLEALSHLLDDFLRVPGTPIRFGLDGIVGFIPGIGDIVGGLASSIIIVAAFVRGVPKVTVARMVLNVAIETVAGSVPILGNLFDIGWRANRRNYRLLEESIHSPARPTSGSWLMLAGVCLVLAGLAAIPVVLAAWLLVGIGHLLHGAGMPGVR